MSRHISKRRTAGVVAILVASIAGASAYAFTAGNTVGNHKAGVGTATVSGYTVDPASVAYTVSGDGLYWTNVRIDVGAAASDVAASVDLNPDTTTWVDCTLDIGTFWNCSFKGGLDVAGGTNPNLATGWPVGPQGANSKLTVAAVSVGVVTVG